MASYLVVDLERSSVKYGDVPFLGRAGHVKVSDDVVGAAVRYLVEHTKFLEAIASDLLRVQVDVDKVSLLGIIFNIANH